MRQMQRSELGVGRGGGFFEREEETLGEKDQLCLVGCG